jgi:dihydroorotase
MNIIIKAALIIEPGSPYHKKICDVFVSDGIIKKIEKSIDVKADLEIDGRNCTLSAGFFDLHVSFGEPGFEFKEDIVSGCKAAAAGGFTDVIQMPSTFPVMQNSAGIEMITNKIKSGLVTVHAAGALSVDMEGKEMTEMYDMHKSGAVCFTDHKSAVQDGGVMLRSLLYAKTFDGLVMSFSDDRSLSGKGQMNEGPVSTQLGLKGIPSLAEEMMVARDLMLCEYAEGRIHFSTISTKGSVELIRKAKKAGLKITCDVAAHNLLLDESSLEEFDTRFKVKPPLRSQADISALKEGLKDGTIDAICSDHIPEDVENKQKEFDLAAFGAGALETAFAAAHTALKDSMPIEQIIEKFTAGPRKIISKTQIKIAEGETACFTLFNPDEAWTVKVSDIKSKSKNNPFVGMKLSGKVKAVLNKGQHEIFLNADITQPLV